VSGLLKESCPCGATIELPDTHGAYLSSWRDDHKACRMNQPLVQNGFFTRTEERLNAFGAQIARDGTAIQTQTEISAGLRRALELATASGELLHAHSENLIERMYEMEKLAGLHDPCPTCGDRESTRDGCSKCNGSGLNPIPKWDRLNRDGVRDPSTVEDSGQYGNEKNPRKRAAG
jgi:hypothetical protein